MIDNYEIFENLLKIYPCIFHISNKYYYIGCAVFRECVAEEKKLYIEFCEEFCRIRTDWKKKNVSFDGLKQLFEKTMFKNDFGYTDDLYYKAKSDLNDMFFSLSNEEQKEIGNQLDNIKIALFLCEGCFHRIEMI